METLRDSFGFMALDEASMMAVLDRTFLVDNLDIDLVYAQLSSLINKETSSVYRTIGLLT